MSIEKASERVVSAKLAVWHLEEAVRYFRLSSEQQQNAKYVAAPRGMLKTNLDGALKDFGEAVWEEEHKWESI